MNSKSNSKINANFNVTSEAIKKIREALIKRNTPQSALRVGVKGGGCSGFSYVIEFCDSPPHKKDLIFNFDDVLVYIDKKSIVYLNNTTLDWEKTLMHQGFKFNNPQVKSDCGCGESFSV